jgi:hypothetical protein
VNRMPAPDPTRMGGLTWTQRTKGQLAPRERRRLLGRIAKAQAVYIAGRIRLATGRIPAGARALSAAGLSPPDSSLARAAEAASREQPRSIIGHGYRTWMFGAALAALDGSAMNPELFYVASLLHDYGIVNAVPGEDFTLRSVSRLEQCASDAGVSSASIDTASDAISVHTTPGICIERDGALGVYVQAGALLDLTGARAGELTRAYRDQVSRQHPRDGVIADVLGMIKAEAEANPAGRLALVTRCGLPVALRLCPLKPH